MATVKEMMMQDAAASIETSYEMNVGDTFEGNLDGASDADWVAVELEAGTTYQIGLSSRGDEGADDTVLVLRDSKGGMIAMNDDIRSIGGPDAGPEDDANLNSSLKFRPQEDGTYYIDASSYNNIPIPGSDDNSGDYTITVEALDLPGDIVGTDADEKLNGTDAGEEIAGLGGNDAIDGMGGDDEIDGGDGHDLLTGGPGADVLKGGDGTDTISYEYSPMGVTINLNDGTAIGGDADGDELGEDIENVRGSMHDDTLTGTDDASDGNSLWGLAGNDTLSGRDGPDMLYGGAGDDVLDGGDEEDTLEGGYGADMLTGGGGADTASYANSTMGVTVRLHANKAMGGDAEGDTFVDMTTVEYSVPAEDPEDPPVIKEETVPDFVHLTGSAMADILAGDSRDNTIKGGGGDDKIYGGPGGGDDDLQGEGGDDMLFGGRGDDDLSGGMGNDSLWGGPGADNFYGGAGNDLIYADEADVDGIPGASPAGTIDGGTDMGGGDIDTVSFEKLVDTEITFALGRLNEDDEIQPATANAINVENVIGTDEDDTITGLDESEDDQDDAPNEIEGGDGGDTLVGGEGGGDTVSYVSSDRRVRVDLGDSTDGDGGASNSGGHATGDSLIGFENIKGSAYGDVLAAFDGGGTLWGLGGDDSLEGGAGNDTLEGGAGADELDGGYTPYNDAGEAVGTRPVDDGNRNFQTNTLSYAGSDAGVTVDMVSATASGGHAQGDEIETYEYNVVGDPGDDDDDEEVDIATFVNVTGSAHNDNLSGDRFGNHLVGGAGDDSLRGGGGGDILSGGPGADRMDGGSSLRFVDDVTTSPEDESVVHEDWAAYRGAKDNGVTVNLNTGRGTDGDAKGDTLKNIELIWGSKQGDTFIASAGADTIHGDGGSDTVSYEASKHGVNVVLPTSRR